MSSIVDFDSPFFLEQQRQKMILRLRVRNITNHAVIDAMSAIPRHLFVAKPHVRFAYSDTALPIGYEQTITQPYFVALMSEWLCETKRPLKKVLEIGTGSGYQTAVLSKLCEWVYTAERIQPLFCHAKERLTNLGFLNISYQGVDGGIGWQKFAPFDAVIVTAAASHSSYNSLIQQLAVGGRCVVPAVDGGKQYLKMLERSENGFFQVQKEDVAVNFVPMLSGSSC